jgi:DNA-directed RNA polymerase specialized sigma subunit
MKADQNLVKQAIRENDERKDEDKLTRKQIAQMFDLTSARISQIASKMKSEAKDRAEAANDEPTPPMAA